jgi:tRNA pseudouridine38-40 synthase
VQFQTKQRCAVWIWYRGDFFRGFQSQAGGQTIQQAFEEALGRAGAPQGISASGRTDRGVHARMQVLSLWVPKEWPTEEVNARLSPLLPSEALGVVAVSRSPPGFHAAWVASGKEYRYRFALGREVPEAWRGLAWHVRTHPRFEGRSPEPDRVAEALSRATGARDFIAFHEKGSAQKIRTLSTASLHDLGGGVFEARLVGDGFARYQARYLVGAAALVSSGLLESSDYERALDSGSSIRGVKAPAEALTLWEVRFPGALDPFPQALREEAPGLPEGPPFSTATAGGSPRTSPEGR